MGSSVTWSKPYNGVGGKGEVMVKDRPIWALGAMSGTSLDGVDAAMVLDLRLLQSLKSGDPVQLDALLGDIDPLREGPLRFT